MAAKLEPAPPLRVYVTWCETCGTVVFADEKRLAHSDNSCPSCPHGEGRMRSERYTRGTWPAPKKRWKR